MCIVADIAHQQDFPIVQTEADIAHKQDFPVCIVADIAHQ